MHTLDCLQQWYGWNQLQKKKKMVNEQKYNGNKQKQKWTGASGHPTQWTLAKHFNENDIFSPFRLKFYLNFSFHGYEMQMTEEQRDISFLFSSTGLHCLHRPPLPPPLFHKPTAALSFFRRFHFPFFIAFFSPRPRPRARTPSPMIFWCQKNWMLHAVCHWCHKMNFVKIFSRGGKSRRDTQCQWYCLCSIVYARFCTVFSDVNQEEEKVSSQGNTRTITFIFSMQWMLCALVLCVTGWGTRTRAYINLTCVFDYICLCKH